MVREALTEQRLHIMPDPEAAAYWVALSAEGLTAQEEELLSEWLSSNPARLNAYDQANQACRALSEARDDEILEAMRRRALGTISAPVARLPRWAAAASMVFLIAAACLVVSLSNLAKHVAPNASDRPQFALVYASARGQVKEVRLPDGSLMTLDTDTLARGRFSRGIRTVRLLRGRAYFAVRHDPERPFSVFASNRHILAIGTKFDVAVIRGELIVRLLEGKVAVGSGDAVAQPVMLTPNQSFIERGGKVKVAPLDSADELFSWRRGFAYFSNETLADAAAELNRYSDEQIVVASRNVSALRISGQFRTGDPERFARTVSKIHPVRVVRRSATQIEIVPR